MSPDVREAWVRYEAGNLKANLSYESVQAFRAKYEPRAGRWDEAKQRATKQNRAAEDQN